MTDCFCKNQAIHCFNIFQTLHHIRPMLYSQKNGVELQYDDTFDKSMQKMNKGMFGGVAMSTNPLAFIDVSLESISIKIYPFRPIQTESQEYSTRSFIKLGINLHIETFLYQDLKMDDHELKIAINPNFDCILSESG